MLVSPDLNREAPKTAKKKILAHLAAGHLDSVTGREEVARHIVDSAEYLISIRINWKIPRIKDGIQRMIWRER